MGKRRQKKRKSTDVAVPNRKTEMKSTTKHKITERWQRQCEEERAGRWCYQIQRAVGRMRNTVRQRKKNQLYQDYGLDTHG